MECSQYVGINMSLFRILCCIFFVNYSRTLPSQDSKHTGNGRGHITLVNIANSSTQICCVLWGSYVVILHLSFIMCFWHSIVHTWVPCSTGLATFASMKQACADSHATVLSQGQNNHAPSHAPIHALQLCSKPVASRYWPFERLSTFNFDFSSNVKAILGQNLIYYPCRIKPVGKFIKPQI